MDGPLDRLRTEYGLTYILVSHALAALAHMCEHLLVMQHGRAVEELTRDALQTMTTKKDYSRDLLIASEGFTRETVG